jgi:nitrous oxide reductase accessory protein NosL
MYPARNTKFQSQIVFKNGSFVAFDGTKDLFKFLLNMEGYDKKHTKDDVAVAWVKDFNSAEWIDAKDAHFIIGSDVFGPMGKEIIPLSDHMAAMAFKDKHGGAPIHYAEITMEVIDSLDKGKVKMEEHKHKMEMKEGMEMKKEHKMEGHEMEMKHE